MLGKLLKYEIPALGRKLVPLYAAWAATAVLLGIMIGPAQEKYGFMMVISALLYSGVATAIFVMAIIMIIHRYTNSLLGDEAYFNMVLPVSASAHIANKLISALLWILLTGVAAVVTVLIIGFFGAELYSIPNIWKYISPYINDNMVMMIVEMVVLSVMGLVKTVLQIYAAVTIGHQARQHVTLASIGAYIGVMIFESLAGRVFMAIFPAMEKHMEQFSDFGEFQLFAIPSMLMTLFFIVIYFIICKTLLEKRLNLS